LDCRLQRTSTNDYYFCIPQTYVLKDRTPSAAAPRNPRAGESEKYVLLDPGVRIFQIIYDPPRSRAVEVAPLPHL